MNEHKLTSQKSYLGPWDDEKNCPADTVDSEQVGKIFIEEHRKKRLAYQGEFKNGLAEGKGIYYYSNGAVYDGEFKNNNREGKGIMKYASGTVYEGEFKNGKREGKGIFRYADGTVYEGEFKNDSLIKKIMIKIDSIASYKIQNKPINEPIIHQKEIKQFQIQNKPMKNVLPEVRGIMKCANRDIYEDNWKNREIEGWKITTNKKDTRYYCQYQNSIMQKKYKIQRIQYNNGAVYKGEFKNGKREGKGFYQCNGNYYEGEFKNDLFDGKGVMKFLFKGGYEGDFKNGLPEGRGVWKVSDGSVYEGDFKNGLPEGRGVWKYADGADVYEGEFKNGVRDGKGIFKYGNGNVYKGIWKDDERIDKGICIFANGNVYHIENSRLSCKVKSELSGNTKSNRRNLLPVKNKPLYRDKEQDKVRFILVKN